jgi:hypothetical protein
MTLKTTSSNEFLFGPHNVKIHEAERQSSKIQSKNL